MIGTPLAMSYLVRSKITCLSTRPLPVFDHFLYFKEGCTSNLQLSVPSASSDVFSGCWFHIWKRKTKAHHVSVTLDHPPKKTHTHKKKQLAPCVMAIRIRTKGPSTKKMT